MKGDGLAVPLGSLSERERVVVNEVVSGTPLKVIGWRLSISIQAVSTHLLRAQRKLRVRSRSDLLVLCAGEPRSLDDIQQRLSPRLTAAEVSVGNAIVAGESYSAIAEARSTSPRTIQCQVRQVFRKCGVTSRFELAALARRDGSVRAITDQRL
jgi:DNA-binding NarL/FixJ family response regulator